ncbi:MAG TPA: FtsQ-type POTRA domain-containing protein [Gemmatimonadaceae bacterium]|nr:FtsQ-type POTRA domain-containing protein [Gemmatimonadaceae bacterium]
MSEGAKGGDTPKRVRRWLIPAAIAAGAFVVLLAPWWGPAIMRQMSFFRVRRVEVVGVRYVDAREILDRLNVDTTESVWDDPSAWEARVAEHPLVQEVVIERNLPGTLVVRLVEHAPVALVPGNNGFRAFDARGVALPIDPAKVEVNAPILARPDGVLLRFLGEARTVAPSIYARLSEVRREIPSGELLFVLDSTPVRARADITLSRLADVELVEQDLARRKLRAAELDLRYRDQVIARLP